MTDNPPSYEETLREIKKEAISKIKRYLGYSDLSQAEFSNLIREAATAPDLQEYVEKAINFEHTIENMTENQEIEKFVENMINIIGKVHKFKLDKEVERTKIELDQGLERTRKHYQEQINQTIRQNNLEREEWWRKYNAGEHDWQKDNKKKEEEAKKILEGLLKQRDGSNSESREFTERNKKDDIDKVETELRKRKVSEQKLNQRLGISDWREKINQSSDVIQSQRRRFEIEKEIKDLEKEGVCDYCKETKILDWDSQ